MDNAQLFEFIIGPYGALAVMAVVIVVLYRQNVAYRAEIDGLKDKILSEALDSKKLAKAMLERLDGSSRGKSREPHDWDYER